MDIIPKIKIVVKKLIMSKYPEITNFKIKDLFEEIHGSYNILGSHYIAEFTTSECLSTKQQMEIDIEIKSLLIMLSPEDNPFHYKKPEISSFFDCDDGNGFVFSAEYGYKH
jgi:hypothetical protein